ncbi:MAG TPA: ornithine cyclodeaminase family protein [Nitrososphaerales archaeon]|nr:ornithine cyclodeaminase family protein [Nitrososphaerales archaeon]
MTLVLGEKAVGGLLSMKEVVQAVDDCFRRVPESLAVNTPRTRTIVPGATLNVMHGAIPYLGRAGVKCYLSSRRGTRFVFVLFNLEDAEPLAIMGADALGRFRTGAASAVATKHLAGTKSMRFAVAGSGKQARTQVLAMAEVATLESVTAWSPNSTHLADFVRGLGAVGIDAKPAGSLRDAFASSDVATTITTAKAPFVTRDDVQSLIHINLCGSNSSNKSEATPQAVAEFQTVVTDDVEQARVESGDLIGAVEAGLLSWANVVRLGDVVSGKINPGHKTLFKSNGVAIEDVAVASLVYEKARHSSEFSGSDVEIGTGKEKTADQS